jgi:hypothetical protein
MVLFPALEYVGLNDYIVVLKGALKNGRDSEICDKLSRVTDRCVESTRTVCLYATGEQLTGKLPDFAPLLNDGFL